MLRWSGTGFSMSWLHWLRSDKMMISLDSWLVWGGSN